MAKSKYEYVREFESANDYRLLPESYVVVRVDGQCFHRFSKDHNFLKPNDKRCLDLMNKSALHVMRSFYPNIVMAYGQSDEFSFILRRFTSMFNRRQCKVTSLITSAFTSAFVYYWPQFFKSNQRLLYRQYEEYAPNGDVGSSDATSTNLMINAEQLLKYPPSFDGRCVMYPNEKTLKDYLRWRQVDCHINNLYNTTFYALTGEYSRYVATSEEQFEVYLPSTQSPPNRTYYNAQGATQKLSGTSSGDKNEILFTDYAINYNNEPEQFRKGTIITLSLPSDISNQMEQTGQNRATKSAIKKLKEIQDNFSSLQEAQQTSFFQVMHCDIIGDHFWQTYDSLLQL